MQLGIATKIFVGFSGLLLGMILLAMLSVREIRSAAEDLRAIRDGHLALARTAAQLQTHQQNRLRDLRRALEEPELRSRSVILRIAVTYYPEVIESGVEAMMAACRQLIHNRSHPRPHDIAFCKSLNHRIQPMKKASTELHALAQDMESAARNKEPSLALVAAELDTKGEALRSAVFKLDRFLRSETDRAVSRAESKEVQAIWRVVISTVCALGLGALVTFTAARTLAPIRPLVRYARALARGDYQQPLDVGKVGEFVDLAHELRRIANARDEREEALDRQAKELAKAYVRVAELKRYHESIVRSLRTGIVVTDRHGAITSTNRAAATQWELVDVTGRSLAELHLGKILHDRFGSFETQLHRAPCTAEAVRIHDEQLADISLALLEYDGGHMLGLVVALEDVTEAVRTKEALLRSERLATIGRMSAHVTHELRNPLASISLNAELLEELSLAAEEDRARPGDVQEARQLCRAINREAERLNALAEEYLRFARLPQPDLVLTAPHTLLQSLALFVDRDCKAASVQLRLDIEPNLPEIRVDPNQLRQALLNLLRNGKESMPHGGELLLGARQHNKQVALYVRDHGHGIPNEVLNHIFDPFYSTKLTGTGLGLALTQQIVQEHGARLEVVSSPGKGSEFSVYFEEAAPSSSRKQS
ncbi:MAG: PAS domain-containing protein [Myxococcales bacterium]|nr:PAS domain-containing protein [Myxococcales bacterium]